jgi:hypothetical protein
MSTSTLGKLTIQHQKHSTQEIRKRKPNIGENYKRSLQIARAGVN